MGLSLRELSVAIRRQETPFYARLYKMAKAVRGVSFPVVKPVHNALYQEWDLRTSLWHEFWRVVYYEPMFKSQCKQVGSGFKMHYGRNGSARVHGDLQVHFGDNVTIFDNVTFVGLKVLDKPELRVGDNTYIGPAVRFLVAKSVRIGSHCMITSKMITDNPGHNTRDVLARLSPGGGSPAIETIRPVRIGDFCFIAADTYVYPGVQIGDGVVARVGTHIDRDIPPFCLVGGNRFKIFKKLPVPEEMKDIVGKDRYESYLEAHRRLDLDGATTENQVSRE